MSAFGHKQASRRAIGVSALLPKADIPKCGREHTKATMAKTRRLAGVQRAPLFRRI
jgi:hypothetical protein